MHTDFYVYEHLATGSKDIACDEYHLPHHIAEHVDYITPGIRLREDPRVVKMMSKRQEKRYASDLIGYRAHNTGGKPVPKVWTEPLTNGQSPFNSSVCDTYITNVCIRSMLDLTLN